MVICTLFGKGAEYVSSVIPKIAPASKQIGVGVEVGCEISTEIGKRIVKKLRDEEVAVIQSLNGFRSTRMCYRLSRQQRNFDLTKQHNSVKIRVKHTIQDRIERNARFVDWYSRYQKQKNYQPKN